MEDEITSVRLSTIEDSTESEPVIIAAPAFIRLSATETLMLAQAAKVFSFFRDFSSSSELFKYFLQILQVNFQRFIIKVFSRQFQVRIFIAFGKVIYGISFSVFFVKR